MCIFADWCFQFRGALSPLHKTRKSPQNPLFFGKSAWPFDVTSASHVTQNTHMNKHTNTQARTHTHTHKHAHTTYKYDNAHVHCVDV